MDDRQLLHLQLACRDANEHEESEDEAVFDYLQNIADCNSDENDENSQVRGHPASLHEYVLMSLCLKRRIILAKGTVEIAKTRLCCPDF